MLLLLKSTRYERHNGKGSGNDFVFVSTKFFVYNDLSVQSYKLLDFASRVVSFTILLLS